MPGQMSTFYIRPGLISEIRPFIEGQLAAFCQEGNIIHDAIGTGPVKFL